MNKKHTELLLFLTCHVLDDQQELSPDQQVKFDKLSDVPEAPNSQRDMFHSITHPSEERDPAWKWRRSP